MVALKLVRGLIIAYGDLQLQANNNLSEVEKRGLTKSSTAHDRHDLSSTWSR